MTKTPSFAKVSFHIRILGTYCLHIKDASRKYSASQAILDLYDAEGNFGCTIAAGGTFLMHTALVFIASFGRVYGKRN